MSISDCNIGLAVYRKKPEYGPAEVNIETLKATNVENKYFLENGSRMSVDKIDIQPNKKGLYGLLYGEE